MINMQLCRKRKSVERGDGNLIIFVGHIPLKICQMFYHFSKFHPSSKLWAIPLRKREKGYLACIYLLKVNNRNTRTRCEICSKLTIKIPERHYWRRSSVFIVNFEHISYLFLLFLILALDLWLPKVQIDNLITAQILYNVLEKKTS